MRPTTHLHFRLDAEHKDFHINGDKLARSKGRQSTH